MRLKDADALMDTLKKRTSAAYPNELWGLMLAQDVVENAPTIEAVVLPCKVGNTVWTILHKKIHEAKVVCIRPFVFEDFVEFRGNVEITYADPFYSDGRPLTQELFAVFGKDTFLTHEEAVAALAKMDGRSEGE